MVELFTYLSRSDILQTDVYNAVHTLIIGLHEQRGMTLETMDYLVEIIDFGPTDHAASFHGNSVDDCVYS
jgi:hypothetical protein